MAFQGELDDGTVGVFAGGDPVADRVIAIGDTLFGGIVNDLDITRGVSDDGRIPIRYSLDGFAVSGVAIATPVQTATPDEVIVEFGTHLAGGLAELAASDDAYYKVRSEHGFLASEANIVQVHYQLSTTVDAPGIVRVSEETRLNHPGGTATVFLFNTQTGDYDQVLQYSTTETDTLVQSTELDGETYVDETGTILQRSKYTIVATFTASGFDASIDLVELQLSE